MRGIWATSFFEYVIKKIKKIEVFIIINNEKYIITRERKNPDNTISLTLRKNRG